MNHINFSTENYLVLKSQNKFTFCYISKLISVKVNIEEFEDRLVPCASVWRVKLLDWRAPVPNYKLLPSTPDMHCFRNSHFSFWQWYNSLALLSRQYSKGEPPYISSEQVERWDVQLVGLNWAFSTLLECFFPEIKVTWSISKGDFSSVMIALTWVVASSAYLVFWCRATSSVQHFLN